jgi:hypothetical protein
MGFREINVQEVRERLKQIRAEQENKKDFVEAYKIYKKAKRGSQKNNNL